MTVKFHGASHVVVANYRAATNDERCNHVNDDNVPIYYEPLMPHQQKTACVQPFNMLFGSVREGGDVYTTVMFDVLRTP